MYLSQSVPVCDGLSWVSQHFVPVISSKAYSIWAGSAHTNHLIVSNPVMITLTCTSIHKAMIFLNLNRKINSLEILLGKSSCDFLNLKQNIDVSRAELVIWSESRIGEFALLVINRLNTSTF